MSLTITPSPFGSLTVSVAETNSTLSVTTVATSPSVLSMALGVPGPQGETGSQGPAGANGVGVPTGGTTGQVLAKIDGTNYNTEWVNAATGDFLPLSGGTMSVGALVDFASTSGNDSEIGAWGFGVENTSGQVSYIEPQEIRIYDGTSTTGTRLIASGVQFNDSSTQVTAGLPLTGGTVTGAVNLFNPDQPTPLTVTDGNGIVFIAGGDIQISNPDSTSVLEIIPTGITFPDSSTQTTAFIPENYLSSTAIASTYYPIPTGTTSQYIRGDGSLYTFPAVGDRYLSTSTTSLTISNGTKTLTIGTGLSYSTQQDVTIAYDASNHMHGTVTSYNSTTGVMVADVYNKTGSGTYTAWTVNVGGVVGGSYLQTANNLSELTATASTARSNLGLGSMAVETATNYLSTSAAASTYQTQSGMSAYLSTSAASSTYLTQSNASSTYLTQANASTTYIGTSAYATTAQAQAGSSTTTVISPSTFFDARWFAGSKSMVQITWSTSVSGTGASAGTQNANARLNIAPTTATGYAIASAVIANNSRGTIFNNGFDFSKRVSFGLRVARNVASPDTNSVWRFSIGKSSVTDASDLSARGLMVKVSGGGALQLLVHNGTTLTTTTSSYTPANGVSYDLVVTSDGAGNVTLYVNGSSVATSTGGPTSAGSANANVMMFEVQNTATISGSPQSICISDYFVQVNS